MTKNNHPYSSKQQLFLEFMYKLKTTQHSQRDFIFISQQLLEKMEAESSKMQELKTAMQAKTKQFKHSY